MTDHHDDYLDQLANLPPDQPIPTPPISHQIDTVTIPYVEELAALEWARVDPTQPPLTPQQRARLTELHRLLT